MESQSMDDSLCIMYENIIPRPEVEIVNEIERIRSQENVPRRRRTQVDQEPSQANALDDSVHIVQENIPRQVTTSSQNAENNASSGEPAQAATGVPQAIEDDDFIQILRENIRREVTTSSQNAENDDEPAGNRKEVKCGICLDDLDAILESNRKLGSTICGHMFCDMCMKLSKKNSSFCPSCRKRLGKNQYHLLYF